MIYSDAGHLEDEVSSQSPTSSEDEELMSQSPISPLKGGRGFYKVGEGNRTKRSKEGIKMFCMCRWVESILIRQVMVSCKSSWFSAPGFTSFWLNVTLAPGAGMPKGCRLYYLKLVLRILIQTCCLSTSYILVRVST